MTKSVVEIKKYNFSKDLLSEINSDYYVKDLWPLVYILSDENIKEAYVGETTDALSRMSNHLKNNEKNKLTAVRLVTSDKFNKSATLDIESNLIKYLAGDGKYKLLNGNAGLANHNYYQKNEIYWDIFEDIWENLKVEGIVKNTIRAVNNSNLFKYSPYKSLSYEQRVGLIGIMKSLLSQKIDTIIVEGGAGTGKSILAIFLFKLLSAESSDVDFSDFGDEEEEFLGLVSALRITYPNPSMALVIPMAGFRQTIKSVFKNIKGLSAQMVIGPSEVADTRFDILVVDESHRLRKNVNLMAGHSNVFKNINRRLSLIEGNELDWIVKQSDKRILLYDEGQSIKPSDVNEADFDLLKSRKASMTVPLKSQLRVEGGNDYIAYIDKLLNCSFENNEDRFVSDKYEFVFFDSIQEMIDKVKTRDSEVGLSRLIAGFSWKWISKNNNNLNDIQIDGVELKWNSTHKDWVNSVNAINEVGCIHTTQGYDLNYAGVIFGNEISYDKSSNKIVIKKNNYCDINGKKSIKDPEELKSYVINIYKTILSRAIKGTYVYICDKDLREYFKNYIKAADRNIKEDVYDIMEYPKTYEMIELPVFESVGCGELLIADSTPQDSAMVRKSYLVSGRKYFVLRTSGDSMNKAGIRSGDLVLCEKNYHPQNGDNVVALIGDDATIKKYYQENSFIVLKPCSTNPEYKNMKFRADGEDVKIQAVVKRVLPK